MKVTGEQIGAIASSLGGIAAIFNPVAGPVITGVVSAATKLNELIQAMRQEVVRRDGESDADYNARVSKEVQEAWDKVSTDFLASRAGMLESFKNHPGA